LWTDESATDFLGPFCVHGLAGNFIDLPDSCLLTDTLVETPLTECDFRCLEVDSRIQGLEVSILGPASMVGDVISSKGGVGGLGESGAALQFRMLPSASSPSESPSIQLHPY
jgi:hypothetical protein